MPSDDVKAHARERFSQYAQGYVNSETHSQGADLDRVLEVAAPQARLARLRHRHRRRTHRPQDRAARPPYDRHRLCADHAGERPYLHSESGGGER